jgi:hypothetical protein
MDKSFKLVGAKKFWYPMSIEMTAFKQQKDTKCLEIEPSIVVSLTIWRAGALIIKLNGKSWINVLEPEINGQERIKV